MKRPSVKLRAGDTIVCRVIESDPHAERIGLTIMGVSPSTRVTYEPPGGESWEAFRDRVAGVRIDSRPRRINHRPMTATQDRSEAGQLIREG